ncbi:hypothetical protein FHG87_001766 [Trinorchestia longiramus]|nr:hypothetical protein FHG87_001766 [Trinorchestia longiramus]
MTLDRTHLDTNTEVLSRKGRKLTFLTSEIHGNSCCVAVVSLETKAQVEPQPLHSQLLIPVVSTAASAESRAAVDNRTAVDGRADADSRADADGKATANGRAADRRAADSTRPDSTRADGAYIDSTAADSQLLISELLAAQLIIRSLVFVRGLTIRFWSIWLSAFLFNVSYFSETVLSYDYHFCSSL